MEKIKGLIRLLLPEPIVDILILINNRIDTRLKLLQGYYRDYKRYKKSDLTVIRMLNEHQLIAKMTFHYHSIEKGLSHNDLRLGFGYNALTNLLNAMNKYCISGYDRTHTAYLTSLSVINEYIKLHQLVTEFEQSTLLVLLKEEMIRLSEGVNIEDMGGVYNLSRKDIIFKTHVDFESLSQYRFSVRDFSNEALNLSDIEKAIRISQKTPSVCNRQPWHTYLIRDKEVISNLLLLQGGLTGQGSNIDSLILVTSDNNSLNTYRERNQGFVDSGMYSMSLLYAFASLGIAGCPLNANMPFRNENRVRNIMSIPSHQNLTMFIAIGGYPENFNVPKSKRFSLDTILTRID